MIPSLKDRLVAAYRVFRNPVGIVRLTFADSPEDGSLKYRDTGKRFPALTGMVLVTYVFGEGRVIYIRRLVEHDRNN